MIGIVSWFRGVGEGASAKTPETRFLSVNSRAGALTFFKTTEDNTSPYAARTVGL
jgi:hypothetical protein